MTVTTMPELITGGVDTHLDVHVAAALDAIGGVLGVESFPANAAGYRRLLAWLRGFGPVDARGPAGEDDPGRLELFELLGAGLKREDLGVDLAFAHTTRDDLRILRSEIEDGDRAVPGHAQ